MDDGGSANQSGQKAKHKRRSKNDNQGRTFRCGCGKCYLSYPALYTHIKTKHDGTTPKGTNTSQFQTGRGRGRPRKIFTQAQQQERIQDQIKLSGLHPHDKLGGKGGPVGHLESVVTKEKFEAELSILTHLGVLGGPTSVREWFVDSVEDVSTKDVLFQLV